MSYVEFIKNAIEKLYFVIKHEFMRNIEKVDIIKKKHLESTKRKYFKILQSFYIHISRMLCI